MKMIDVTPEGWPTRVGAHYSVKSLQLDVAKAEEGITWELLPHAFRDPKFGDTYPLPSRKLDLARLVNIDVPSNKGRVLDSGCRYLKRARAEHKKRQNHQKSARLDMGSRLDNIGKQHDNYTQHVKRMRIEARDAAQSVRDEAAKQIANLNDLFSLGREGLEAQMKAHLAGEKWKDETIDARAFRECFRMVTQAVKGLGLPSDQREVAESAIMEEAAASIRATREIVGFEQVPSTESDATKN